MWLLLFTRTHLLSHQACRVETLMTGLSWKHWWCRPLICIYMWVKAIWGVKFGTCWLIPAELNIQDYRLQNPDWSSLTWPSLVSREPRNTSQICTTAPNSIFSCSAVFAPAYQTDGMSGMCERGGHLQFYTMLSDQSGGWRWQVTGQGVACSSALGSCVNHPAWLSSEHPWSVLSLTDGLTLEPRNLQSKKNRQDLGCISNKCYFQYFMDDARWLGPAAGIHLYQQTCSALVTKKQNLRF